MTSKEIAERLGISPATVSLAINGKPGISEKTRAKILAEIKKLNCEDLIRNSSAANSSAADSNYVRESESKTIGFVIYKNGGKMLGLNSFYPLILNSVEAIARKYNYNLVIINVDEKDIEHQVHYITNAGCIGYVIFATEMHENMLSYFDELRLPFVVLDNYFIDRDINSVKVNNEQGCYLAIHHLLEAGHKRIGYLSSGLNINSFLERRKYSLTLLQDAGISSMPLYTIGYPIDEAAAGMHQLLSRIPKGELPTAFLADNDLVAIGAMQALKESGYSIPEDFSFVGNADRPISSLVSPKLTTIRVPQERFGSEAVFQLIQQLEGENHTFTKVEVNGELIERESVRKIN